MKQNKIDRLLLEFDCDPKKHTFAPPGFNERRLLNRIMELKLDLEKLLETELSVDGLSQYQDGALFTTFYHSEDFSNQKSRLYLSCFGDLCTVDSNFLSCVDTKPLIVILKSHDFVYIDISDLEQPYSGTHRFFSQLSWFDRYFTISF